MTNNEELNKVTIEGEIDKELLKKRLDELMKYAKEIEQEINKEGE